MSRYVDGIEFITEHCCNCGIPFAMSRDFRDRRRGDKKSFYCPQGHGQYYAGKTEEQKLKERLDQERHRNSELEDRANRISRNYTRMRKRVANGVCPCCNRTFQNLFKHMKSEHPDFADNKTLKAMRLAFGLSQLSLAEEIGITATHISLYENQKHVSEPVKEAIDVWIGQQSA